MPGVSVLAGLPFNFNVRDGVWCSGLKYRIHRRQHGERRCLKEDDGPNAEPAKIPRLLRKSAVHSDAARVFRAPPQGAPDQGIKLRSGAKRVKLATQQYFRSPAVAAPG